MSPVVSAHVPVLTEEVIAWFDLSESMTIVDGTLGGAGHAKLLLHRLGHGGRLIGLDRDPLAIERASSTLTIEEYRFSNCYYRCWGCRGRTLRV